MKFHFFTLAFLFSLSFSTTSLFPNISSIPSWIIKNAPPGPWKAFQNFTGCHPGEKYDDLSKLKNYFNHFGYIPNAPSNFTDDFDDALELAIKTYQKKFNLNVTGELDENLSNVVKDVSVTAFDRWSEVTTLDFTKMTSYFLADIRIGFFLRDHDDGEPFDGRLGTLAHTFSPTNRRFHLDDDEDWVVSGDVIMSSLSTAVDLELVVVHEIGRLLGLGHWSVEEVIMYLTISSTKPAVCQQGSLRWNFNSRNAITKNRKYKYPIQKFEIRSTKFKKS